MAWPFVSVVVCTYNGGRTLPECLGALRRVDYPNYEVIVVNDGSTDNSAAIASQAGFRLITTENRGLSSARNAGLAAARGELIAYVDDDAYPDPQWLKYLAATFLRTPHVAVGGPNVPPADGSAVSHCVANAPGGPIHVLLTDSVAEHIPGCNMAFRKNCLTEIGGFDPQFREAGDDVDICWRLQEKGWTIGFNPAAMVWHRRRNSIWAYWRQQKGYGKAESLLEQKWPEKYNASGNAIWSGRLYGRGLYRMLGRVSRIYHGAWGTAPFQTLHQSPGGLLSQLPAMPEWTLIIFALGFLSALGDLWPAILVVAMPLLVSALTVSLHQAVLSAAQASFPCVRSSRLRLFWLRSLTVLLFLMQPVARLWGRAGSWLVLARKRGLGGLAWPLPRKGQLWSEEWEAPEQKLKGLELAIREQGRPFVRGGDYDPWDLEMKGGFLATVRLLMTVEEHGGGRQMYRFRLMPRYTGVAPIVFLPLAGLAAAAAIDQAWAAAGILAGLCAFIGIWWGMGCGAAMAVLKKALKMKGFYQAQKARPEQMA